MMAANPSRRLTRRRFVLFGGAAATGALFAACAQQSPAPPASPVAQAVVTQVVEKQATVVVTQVVQQQVVVTATPQPQIKGGLDAWEFPHSADDQANIWKPLMLKFKERYPGIEPKIEVLPWSGRREKMLAAFAAGAPPDAAYINSDSISLFGSNGVLQDSGPLISQDIWADMPADIIKSGITWKGKKLFVPAFFYGTGYLGNVAQLTQFGYKPDTTTMTWQDVLDLGAKAKPKGFYATQFSTVDWGDFVQMVWQAGGTVFSDDITKVLLDQQPAHDALTFVANLFKGGFVPKEGALGSEQEGSVASVNYFYTNKQVLSGEIDGSGVAQTVKQVPNLKFTIMGPLKGKEQAALSNSAGWGLFNKSKNTEPTVAWVNFMMEPENLGFYCSIAGDDPSRNAAQPFWIADENAKKFTTTTRQYWRTNQDANYFWQEAKTTAAPHFQAAVLGKTSVEQALADSTKELQKIVDDFWAKVK